MSSSSIRMSQPISKSHNIKKPQPGPRVTLSTLIDMVFSREVQQRAASTQYRKVYHGLGESLYPLKHALDKLEGYVGKSKAKCLTSDLDWRARFETSETYRQLWENSKESYTKRLKKYHQRLENDEKKKYKAEIAAKAALLAKAKQQIDDLFVTVVDLDDHRMRALRLELAAVKLIWITLDNIK